MAKQKEKSELEHLRGELRKLRSENRNLKKRIGRLDKRSHDLDEREEQIQEFELESEKFELTTTVNLKDKCPKCVGKLKATDIGPRIIRNCDTCKYREVKKK